MFHNLRRSWSYSQLNRSLQGIINTPPIHTDPAGRYVAVTQVCKRDLLLYLVATKSFFRFFKPRAVHVLNDGSLDAQDLSLIDAHLPGVNVVAITDMQMGACPRGACWERLALVVDLAQDNYVIQLDCDTVTLKPPLALMALVEQGVSFTQGTNMGKTVVRMTEFGAGLPTQITANSHVQVTAEVNFPKLKGYAELRYVRGCAGFAGFAQGSVNRDSMAAFSTEIESIIGKDKWFEWGSEQVTSNFLIANSPRAEVLPMPDYAYFHANTDLARSRFLHFMGPERFYKGIYGKLGKTVIRELAVPG